MAHGTTTTRLVRSGWLIGALGLAASDIGMYLRMKGWVDGSGATLALWVGALGAAIGYTGWILALGAPLRTRGGALGVGARLDAIIIGLAVAIAFAAIVVLPEAERFSGDVDHAWFIGCLAADAVVTWLSIALVMTNLGLRSRLIAAGLATHTLADTLHASVLGPASDVRMRAIEALLVVSILTWASLAVVTDRSRRHARTLERLARARTIAMIVAACVPTAVLAFVAWPHVPTTAAFLAAVTVPLIALVAIRVRGIVRDLIMLHATVEHQAHHDALTGVWNRAALDEHFADVSFDVLRAVIYLDLDRFKAVNDIHGHDAGDHVLVEVAQRIQRSVRGSDRVVRVGGDEFVVVVTDDDTDVDEFVRRLDRILNNTTYVWNDITLDVGVSAGVALRSDVHASDAIADYADLLKSADHAMLRKKASQRDTASA